MDYELIYTARAVKDIKKLDRVVQKKLKRALENFQKAPFSFGEKLISSKLGGYRFRAGDYRIIFDVEVEKIIILRVGHRREIYKR